jgi:hypothetical protein
MMAENIETVLTSWEINDFVIVTAPSVIGPLPGNT